MGLSVSATETHQKVVVKRGTRSEKLAGTNRRFTQSFGFDYNSKPSAVNTNLSQFAKNYSQKPGKQSQIVSSFDDLQINLKTTQFDLLKQKLKMPTSSKDKEKVSINKQMNSPRFQNDYQLPVNSQPQSQKNSQKKLNSSQTLKKNISNKQSHQNQQNQIQRKNNQMISATKKAYLESSSKDLNSHSKSHTMNPNQKYDFLKSTKNYGKMENQKKQINQINSQQIFVKDNTLYYLNPSSQKLQKRGTLSMNLMSKFQ